MSDRSCREDGLGRLDFQRRRAWPPPRRCLFITFTTDMTAKNQTFRAASEGFNPKTILRPFLGMATPPRTERLIAAVVAGSTPTPFHHPANTGSLPAVVPAISPDQCWANAGLLIGLSSHEIGQKHAKWIEFCVRVARIGPNWRTFGAPAVAGLESTMAKHNRLTAARIRAGQQQHAGCQIHCVEGAIYWPPAGRSR